MRLLHDKPRFAGIRRSRRSSERGQTLLFGLVALVILAVSIFIIFDLQSVIRVKIKTQNAVDSAALVGATWQKNSLNLIGELNLVKACTVLITDTQFGIGRSTADFLTKDHPEDCDTLIKAAAMLTEMQSRISFIGPLIGLGAAQQAAKNNGLNANDVYGKGAYKHYMSVCDDSAYGDTVLSQYIPNYQLDMGGGTLVDLGFKWRTSYQEMLANLLMKSNLASSEPVARGFAVNPNKKMLGYPFLYGHDSAGYLSNKGIYQAISASNWCALKEMLENVDFSDDSWWKSLMVARDTASFPQESEYMPLQISYSAGSAGYYSSLTSGALGGVIAKEKALDPTRDDLKPIAVNSATSSMSNTPYTDNSDPGALGDSDLRYTPLPRIVWACYDITGDLHLEKNYDPEISEDDKYYHKWDPFYVQEANKIYFHSDFKPEYAYKSGAYCSMTAAFSPTLLTGQWSFFSTGSSPKSGETLGDAMRFGNSATSEGRKVNRFADQLANSEAEFKNYRDNLDSASDNSGYQLKCTAVAKPLGFIPLEGSSKKLIPLYAEDPNNSGVRGSSSMILPVFDKVSLITVSLPDNADDKTRDPFDSFYYFLTEYIPELQNVGSLSEMPERMMGMYPDDWGMMVQYHVALVTLNDPAFRARGLAWLNTPLLDADGNDTGMKNSDYCNYWPGGHGSPRSGVGGF